MTYHYDSNNRLTEIDEPSGTTVTFSYDANGQRIKKTTQTGGANPTMTVVNNTYQNGRLAYQTNLGGTVLATFTYDPSGMPESVVVGSDPVNGPRYYYVYNGHGDVVALTDASGTVVASYSYDVWGNITSSSETIPNANGWTNPYRYDGRDGARYDVETGLYWLTTRAYDPTLGRFLQRDPLGRMPLYFPGSDQPYVYAGNNPLVNVDPSGALMMGLGGERVTAAQHVLVVRAHQRVVRVGVGTAGLLAPKGTVCRTFSASRSMSRSPALDRSPSATWLGSSIRMCGRRARCRDARHASGSGASCSVCAGALS